MAKEFNRGRDASLYASTPPLEALKLLVSEAATGDEDNVIMINDVARAFFEAPIGRLVCVEIPMEARCEEDDDKDMVGLLQKSLYGTRDAAANFQTEVKKFMKKIGFTVGRYNASTFRHPGKHLKTMVHGDDFVTTGGRKEAAWLRDKLVERFEIKTKIIGGGEEEEQEGRVLNRIIRRTPTGWEY